MYKILNFLLTHCYSCTVPASKSVTFWLNSVLVNPTKSVPYDTVVCSMVLHSSDVGPELETKPELESPEPYIFTGSGSGTGFGSGSNIKCNKKSKMKNERPTYRI
jgi:hypothetical protein